MGGNVTEDTKVVYTLIGPEGSSRALGEKTCNALCNGKVCLDAEVTAPLLWSTDAPNCYTLQVELQRGSQTWDSQRITVGFKTMAFDADKGFFLNGEWLKLHGVCEHHDLGCLGSAFNKAALRRQFTILKEMGVNSLRTSHNMPAPEFMELADRMGFLVDSEAFDMFKNILELANTARERYVKLYGPVTTMELAKAQSFTWLKNPWPWDYTAKLEG